MFVKRGSAYLKDPWLARDLYIDVILDRSSDKVQSFLAEHAKRPLDNEQRAIALKLLEMERHALLMYTSCAWFFDEISGIETVQVIEYAARAIQLATELSGRDLYAAFAERLRAAKSNIPECGDGARVFERFIRPSIIDLKKVAAHYAVRSTIEDYAETARIYSYTIKREDYRKVSSGKMRLATGRVVVTSDITGDTEPISFCTLYLGGHIFNGGVRTFLGAEAYGAMKEEITAAFERGNIAEIVRLMDTHFGMHSYSLTDLFRDEQRAMLELVLRETMEEFEFTYRDMYENNRILMSFIKELGMPIPKPFLAAAEFTLDFDIKRSLRGGAAEAERLREIAEEIKKWNITLHSPQLEFLARRKIEGLLQDISCVAPDMHRLSEAEKYLHALAALGLEMNPWTVQNMYYRCAKEFWREQISRSREGDRDALAWTGLFGRVGEVLHFNTSVVLPTG